MIVRFINREEELSTLERLFHSTKPQLVILHGRRRVGKTKLLLEFLKRKNGLYLYIPMGGQDAVLNELSKAVEREFFKGFKFQDFTAFLGYLSQKFQKRSVVAIDEFQRLVEFEGSISLIQKFWDEEFSRKSAVLLLSGSSIGTISKVALRGDAPLYGRRTCSIEVSPLKFIHLREWFSRFTAEELVKIYGAFGGTPAYLEKIDERTSPEENILKLILRKDGALYDEPEYLLMEEVRVPSHYMDILTAISLGKHYLSEISDFTKIRRENITTYLKSLESMRLISREYPVLVSKKRSQYTIVDPFFEFWFRFVRPNKGGLESGLEEKVWKNTLGEFSAYLGKVFERIARRYVATMVSSGELKMDADVIGKWQAGEEEIDIIAYSSSEKSGVLFEVKWKELSLPDANAILSRLVERSHLVQGLREKRYGIVAKRIEEKEKIRESGYIVWDLRDMVPS